MFLLQECFAELIGSLGCSCQLLAVDTVDLSDTVNLSLVLSESESESVLLGEEHGLCSELCGEVVVVGVEGSEGVGCDL